MPSCEEPSAALTVHVPKNPRWVATRHDAPRWWNWLRGTQPDWHPNGGNLSPGRSAGTAQIRAEPALCHARGVRGRTRLHTAATHAAAACTRPCLASCRSRSPEPPAPGRAAVSSTPLLERRGQTRAGTRPDRVEADIRRQAIPASALRDRRVCVIGAYGGCCRGYFARRRSCRPRPR
jgi:hypothetical protein